MGTRLTLVLETQLEPETLIQAVVDADALESGPTDAIAPENVTAWDVLTMILMGDIGPVPIAYVAKWDPETGLPDLTEHIAAHGGDMHKALDGVVTNKMERI